MVDTSGQNNDFNILLGIIQNGIEVCKHVLTETTRKEEGMVKRYDTPVGHMDEDMDGDYVRYSDYAALEAENRRLREGLAYCAGRNAGGPKDLVTLAIQEHDKLRKTLEEIALETVELNFGADREVPSRSAKIARRVLGKEKGNVEPSLTEVLRESSAYATKSLREANRKLRELKKEKEG